MQLRNEGQKRDPKIGKKYIILIYQSIREGVQFPLSPQGKTDSEMNRFFLWLFLKFTDFHILFQTIYL